jgi:hypothetical protein
VGAGGGPAAYLGEARLASRLVVWSVRLRQRLVGGGGGGSGSLAGRVGLWAVDSPRSRAFERALVDQRGLTGRFFHDNYFENEITLFWYNIL